MTNSLTLFPARVAIGTVNGAPVYMTLEFSRALADLFSRVGGTTGMSNDELGVEMATPATPGAVLVLAQLLADVHLELSQARAVVAEVAELRKAVSDLEQQTPTAPPADWEHPGKIGAATPNTGAFSTVNKVKITAPANLATFTLTDGKTFSVANTLTLAGTDGASLNVGAGGTLGTAAFTAASTYATKNATTLGGPATDATSTTNLANNMRVALLAAGIGT